jgi:Galactose oxidase, central domain/Kelch motif
MKASHLRFFAIACCLIGLLLSNSPASSAQTFAATGSMTTQRARHTATLLKNGMVLIAGGTEDSSGSTHASAELYNPTTKIFTATGNMTAGRTHHTATLLIDGTVLIAGGYNGDGTHASAEIYNPTSGTFTATNEAMTTARADHTATLLANGTVLIAGGYNGNGIHNSAEVYNPANQSFTATGDMTVERELQTSSLLSDGTVLIAGGENSTYLASAELYNPTAGTFAATGSMHAARKFHTAQVLLNGLVLVVGGYNGTYLASAELYSVTTKTFTLTTGSLAVAREEPTSTLLNDGTVLIAGGYNGAFLSSAQLYNETSELFTTTGSMVAARQASTATLLGASGFVLVAGGFNSSYLSTAELYDGPALQTGIVNPKYVILSVQYAPPGAKSTVDYGNSTNIGTSTSTDSSFSSSKNLSITVGIQTPKGNPVSGALMGGLSDTVSTTNSITQDSTSSVAFNNLSSNDITVPGPASNTVGLAHQFDKIEIWLNPVANFTASGSNVNLSNYFFDLADTSKNMDTVTLTLQQLQNPSLITNQNQLDQLMRSWALPLSDGSSPGLTSADLLNIAAADPFSVPSYSPTFVVYADGTCSTDGRFCLSNNTDIQYASPQQGGQGNVLKFVEGYTKTATEGQSVKDMHSVEFSVDANASGGFLGLFTVDLKTSTTLTFGNQWSTQTSVVMGQTVTTTITPPLFTDNYTGPTEFDIFQDNIYGTLMFNPVEFPGFIIAATPASQSIAPGGKTTYTVSSTVEDGFSGTINLSVASGLPANATPVFSPTSIAANGSSTLTITTTTAVAPGTYTVAISGVNGTNLPHSVQVTLVIT